MHEKAKFVCFIYMQPQKAKFKFVQINMKQVSYTTLYIPYGLPKWESKTPFVGAYELFICPCTSPTLSPTMLYTVTKRLAYDHHVSSWFYA